MNIFEVHGLPRLGSPRRNWFQGLDNSARRNYRPWTSFAETLPILGVCLTLLVGGASGPACAEEKNPALALERMVGQLTDLRLEISNERRRWSEQGPQWRKELALFTTEKERLEADLAEYADEQSGTAEKRAGLLDRRDEIAEALKVFESKVRRAEMALGTIFPLIPEPLRGDLQAAFDDLPETDAAASKTALTRRIQRVLAIYSGIRKMRHEINVVRTVVPLESGAREMDVIHIGLSQAFAVTSDHSIAALGRPAPDGWRWTEEPGIAENVAAAIAVHERGEPARLVRLPLEAAEAQK